MIKKIFKIFFQVTVVFLFVSATAYSLLAAYGYQIDLIHKNIVKTSIIDIDSELEDVKIYVDGELKAEEAPVQINQVKIGNHIVTIEKDGYTTWQKNVKVDARFVKKLENIVLIPKNVPKGMKKLGVLDENGEILHNENTFVVILPDSNLIDVYNFDDDGDYSVEHINYKIDLSDFEDIYLANPENLVFSKPDELEVFNLDDKTTISVLIPDEFEHFHVSFLPYLTGFYLNGDDLYSAKIKDDGTFEEINLLYQSLSESGKNSLEVGTSYGQTFIKESDNLFSFNGTLLTYIDNSVYSFPDISPDKGGAIYVRDNGELVHFDYVVFEKTLMGRFSDKIEKTLWYDEGHHLFIQKSDSIELCDATFDNCSLIMKETSENYVITFPEVCEFIIVENGEIILYTLED